MVHIPTEVIVVTRPVVYADALLDVLSGDPNLAIKGIICSTRARQHPTSPIRNWLGLLRQGGLPYTRYLHQIETQQLARFGLPAWKTPREWAVKLNLPYLQTDDVNRPDVLAFISNCAPEIVLTAHLDQPLGEAILANREFIPVNLHLSLLPNYRGAEPVFATMLQGENRMGVSLHRVTEEQNAGPIFGQRALMRGDRDTLAHNTLQLTRMGGKLFAAIATTARPFREARPQPIGMVTNDWPTRDQVKQFLSNGCQFL